MSIVGNKFRFFVQHLAGPVTEVFPVNDEIELTWKKEDDNVAYDLVLDTELCFQNIPTKGITDFDFFYAIESAGDICDDITIEIETLCNGVWTKVFDGLFATANGSFDVDRCIFRVTPSPNGIYDCLKRVWKNDRFNFLTTPEVTVEEYSVTVVEQTCITTFFGVPVAPRPGPYDGCLTTPSDGWTVKLYDASFSPTGGGLGDWTITTTWIREELTTPCTGGVGGTPDAPCGSDWVLISDDCAGLGTATYARPPKMRLVSIIQNPPDITITYVRIVIADDYDNGHLLRDVLETFLPSTCGITGVVSDFFNINPAGGVPSNDVYNIYALDLADLVLYQRSDVLFPTATNAATVVDISYFELLDSLKSLFNIGWDIEGTELRIEHVSYFESLPTAGLDLTVAPYNIWSAGTNNYRYLALEVPRQESLLITESVNQDFVGTPIIYDSACVVDEDNEKVFSSQQIMTDLDNAIDNPNSIDPTGIFLMAACFDGVDYYINQTEGYLSTQTVPNGSLSAANLMGNFWTYDRELPEGRLNGTDTVFDSSKKRKNQEIGALICCDDLLVFNPIDTVTTGLGSAEIQEARYSAKKDCMEFTLKLQ